MGKRVTQKIYQCDCCGNIPEDGTYLWEMNGEYICQECFDNGAYDTYLEEGETK